MTNLLAVPQHVSEHTYRVGETSSLVPHLDLVDPWNLSCP